eukprot:Gregarina_sp_Poly_1__1933@NODE_1505_length_3978_cov_198_357965_g997_i0_p2_GENE_NODE_1505_length_3978_cov_198_357965_g997_i0NODE_1505_length_3978_cov_198_357965_g997_i0_p2_ORF_typecomplete_len256_score32_33RRM_1/PF00076_22/2_1e07RRM_1/PF00076_22/8_5e03RRM_1/PF00076_22/3_1e03RRM_3/PF08777_11/2_7e06Limkainb1/PF11608_8/0_00063Limkainb1/PF11608_8/9_3e02RRM_5/PF13893_6/0_0035RRM_occluded/PF16842_5/0_0034DNA_pol3_a_NII/PF11490_8/0_003Btz/PF09405_10/0_14Btz/PF09405_10/8_5e02_NODE_1505_length_3978_cov_19
MCDSKSELKPAKFRNKSIFERIAGSGLRRGIDHDDVEDFRRGSRMAYQPARPFGGYRRNGRQDSNPYSYSQRRITMASPAESGPYRRRVEGPPAASRSRSWNHDRFEGNVSAPASTVFIRGLTKEVSDAKLRALFQDAGCEVCMLKIERAPLTTAVVGFTRRDSAAKAVEKIHNTHFMGETIRVMIWERDEESLHKAVQMRQQQEREEEEQIRRELEAMQNSDLEGKLRWAKESSKRQITLASQTPKRSVFERVS